MYKRIIFIMLSAILLITTQSFAQLPPTIQAIHNVADPSLRKMDLYVSVSIIPITSLDNFPFRTATDTIVGLGGVPLSIGVADSNSTSAQDTIKNFIVSLQNGRNYLGLGTGVVNPAAFAPNPDGRNTKLNLFIYDNARLSSTQPGEVQFLFFHGVTDAPTVDLRVANGPTLVDNAAYGDFSGYHSVAPGLYTLELTDAGGNNVLARFTADLSAYAGQAFTFFLSGFLNPAQNQNGAPMGLFAVNPQALIIPFPGNIVGIDEENSAAVSNFTLHQNYPNPFNPSTTIAFDLDKAGKLRLTVFDVRGKNIATILESFTGAGHHEVVWDAAQLPSGVYFYQLESGNLRQVKKMFLLK
jgi:hypothetical protein